MRLMLHRL